jgi:hypothetical protein
MSVSGRDDLETSNKIFFLSFNQAVLLESSIVLFTGLLNKFIPSKDRTTGELINTWLKYIDPSLTLLMVIIITIKAIPVIWSLGHILVEAVPSGINTRQLIQTIMKTIPQIRAVHSVHVWRYSNILVHLIYDNLFYLEQLLVMSLQHYMLFAKKICL